MALVRFLVRAFAVDSMSLQKRMTQCFVLGQYEEALKLGVELKTMTKNEHGEFHPTYLHILGSLGQIYRSLGQHDDAIQHIAEMNDKYQNQFGPLHKSSIHSKHLLGSTYICKGMYDVALTHLNEALSLKKVQTPGEVLEVTETMLEIGKCYAGLRECEKAIKVVKEVKTMVGEKYGYDNILMGKVLEVLASVQSSCGDPETALSNLQTAYSMHLEWYGPDHKATKHTSSLINSLTQASPKA